MTRRAATETRNPCESHPPTSTTRLWSWPPSTTLAGRRPVRLHHRRGRTAAPRRTGPPRPWSPAAKKADQDTGHVREETLGARQEARTPRSRPRCSASSRARSPSRRAAARTRPSRSSSRAPTGSSWCSPSSATRRHPSFCDSTAGRLVRLPVGRHPAALRRPAAQPDPDAGPHRRQLHALAGRLQPGALRGHVLQPDEGVLRAQSSGRYTIDGDVTEWVKVPFNEARYGRDYCGDIVCTNTWFLLRDAMAVWVQDQLARGQDAWPQIQAYLATFDIQDRYDIDGDGNFDEPDGFIDHFQIVHAGGDQAAGDPTYGTDAIWSHRWSPRPRPAVPADCPASTSARGGATGGQHAARQPDRRLGRRLHHPAGERRPRRVRPRVRPRPRSAGPLRHLRQHRRRREQHRLLDPDVLRRQHRRRRSRRDRRRPDRPGRLGDVPARLARRAGRQGAVLRRRLRGREVRAPTARPTTPATTNGRRRCSWSCRTTWSSSSSATPCDRATCMFYSGPGRQPQQHDDQDGRHRAARR